MYTIIQTIYCYNTPGVRLHSVRFKYLYENGRFFQMIFPGVFDEYREPGDYKYREQGDYKGHWGP